jgi:hypothetical protein
MPTPQQAIKAAILCQYITRSLLPIVIFRYYRVAKIIYIVAGYEKNLKIVINEQGDFTYV